MFIDSKLRDEKLLYQIYKSALEYSKICNKDFLYLAIDKRNISKTEIYKTHYEQKHFMHLCGINSKTMSPTEFYLAALRQGITMEDCTSAYKHSISQLSEKISILPNLVNPKNIKMFKQGNPDIQSPQAKFDIGIGNEIGFIGYRYDKIIHMFLPVTNMPQPLTKYCFNPSKISMVFSKEFHERKFKTLEYEVSKGLLGKLDFQYYYTLSSFLDSQILEEAFVKQRIRKETIIQEFEEANIER